MNASVLGIESQGVQSCSKHFIGNEQENQRTRQVSANGTIIEALSSNIDDRTTRAYQPAPVTASVRAGRTRCCGVPYPPRGRSAKR